MAEYVSVDQLFKCETCFHNQNGKCSSWCDSVESYRPAYDKLKKVDAVEVVRCKNCRHCKVNPDSDAYKCNRRGYFAEEVEADGFCNYGKRRDDNG